DKATALAQELSPAEQALMRCREWILANDRREDDWVVTIAEPFSCSLIASAKQGLLVHAMPRAPKANAPQGKDANSAWPEFPICAASEELTYSNASSEGKLALPIRRVQPAFSADFRATDDPAHPLKIMFGAGLKSNQSEDWPLVDASISVAPVFM